MSDKIVIKFKPEGDKKLISAINKLASAQKRLEGTTEGAAEQTGILGRKFARNQKDAGLLGNAFSTLRSKMLLFSFAVSLGGRQLTRFTQTAATIENMTTAFNNLQGGTTNAMVAINKLQIATKNTMSQFDLFQQANNAMVLGITKNSDEMAEMFSIARRLGKALGVDTRRAVESLITGIGRQSRLMLDNIGIIVKSDEAYKKLADQLGIQVKDLTDVQKKQAFLNATMDAARSKVESLGAEQQSASAVDFLSKFTDSIKMLLETDLETALRKLTDLGANQELISDVQDLVSLESARANIKENSKIIKNEIEGIRSMISDLTRSQKLA